MRSDVPYTLANFELEYTLKQDFKLDVSLI